MPRSGGTRGRGRSLSRRRNGTSSRPAKGVRVGRTGVTGSTLTNIGGADKTAVVAISRAPPAQVRTRLTQAQTITIGGVTNLVTMPRTPTASTKWTDFSRVYDRFRVLGMRMRLFFPVAYMSQPNPAVPPNAWAAGTAVCCYYDNDGDLATGFGSAIDYNTAAFYAPVNEVVYTVKTLPTAKVMTQAGGTILADSSWTDIGSAAQMAGDIDCWLSQPPTANSLSTVVFEWDVEFQEMTA